MAKIISFILILIANAILYCRFEISCFNSWEWWALMICVGGWSVLSNDNY